MSYVYQLSACRLTIRGRCYVIYLRCYTTLNSFLSCVIQLTNNHQTSLYIYVRYTLSVVVYLVCCCRVHLMCVYRKGTPSSAEFTIPRKSQIWVVCTSNEDHSIYYYTWLHACKADTPYTDVLYTYKHIRKIFMM